jgi:hypothetical protein
MKTLLINLTLIFNRYGVDTIEMLPAIGSNQNIEFDRDLVRQEKTVNGIKKNLIPDHIGNSCG